MRSPTISFCLILAFAQLTSHGNVHGLNFQQVARRWPEKSVISHEAENSETLSQLPHPSGLPSARKTQLLPIHESGFVRVGRTPIRPRRVASFPVDVVYTWVNQSDPHWAAQNAKFQSKLSKKQHAHTADDGAIASRFIDHDELRHSLRSILRFAKWVRNIYLVVSDEHQRPTWLADEQPRIHVVYHRDIYPARFHKYLPTFSSVAIEVFIDRVPGLSEQFIYLNDDMMFSNTVATGDFFTRDGRPKIAFMKAYGYHDCRKKPFGVLARMAYEWDSKNYMCLLDSKYGHKKRYNPLHMAYPLTRSLMRSMRKDFASSIRATVSQQYRATTGILPVYLAMWNGIYQRRAVALKESQYPSFYTVRFYGHRFFDSANFARFEKLKPFPKLVCLGDFTAGDVDSNGRGAEYKMIRSEDQKLKLPPWNQPNVTILARELAHFYHSFVPDPAPWEISVPEQ